MPANPNETDRPALLIVAGPNGSGKSSAYGDAQIQAGARTVWIINPDLLAARIRDVEGMALIDANLAAVRRIENWLNASVDVHKTIGVETVLSTGKYREVVSRAKVLGFSIWLIYVVLSSPDLNVERVRLRVIKGGHAVPEDKIRERYVRSIAQLPWFLERADRAWLYDNSHASIKLMGEKQNGLITLYDNCHPALEQAIRAFGT